MGQRVARSPAATHTTADEFRAQRAAEAASTAEPADAGALTALYGQLLEMVNDSPPLVRAGDQRVGGLVRGWCGPCRKASGRRGSPVAVVDVMDAQRRGGPVIFVLLTQRPPAGSGDAWRQVPVVLGAPGDDQGRPVTPCPDTALTWCRAHGRLLLITDRLLYEARGALQHELAGHRGRQGSVTAWPG
jgi:hypothetical protein